MATGTASYRISLALVSLCLLFFIHKQGISDYQTVV